LVPQHPSQMTGGVPSHVAASAPASVPASHTLHAMSVGVQVHTPLMHASARYLAPQHPSQVTGAGPSHLAASVEASGEGSLLVPFVELQAATTRDTRNVETKSLFIFRIPQHRACHGLSAPTREKAS
jgi:hypothetical protein